jgi:hypothetical protein
MSSTGDLPPKYKSDRITHIAQHETEQAKDVIRHEPRLLNREMLLSKARSDSRRISAENLCEEEGVW